MRPGLTGLAQVSGRNSLTWADRIDFDILEKALIRLAAIDKGKADIVELRYFAGMSHQEIAEVTGTSEATVKRGWRAARAWLLDALNADKDVRNAEE